MANNSGGPDADFFPKGALAFFGLLIAFIGAVWLALFTLLVRRS